MASNGQTGAIERRHGDANADTLPPAPIPVETLRAISEMIARHPAEMLSVIRRWMADEE